MSRVYEKNELDLNFGLLLKELPQSEQKDYRTALEHLAHRETAGISAVHALTRFYGNALDRLGEQH